MPVTKKTYTTLIELPDVLIGRCSQVLPNRLQCWRGADYLVEEELPPSEKQKEEKKQTDPLSKDPTAAKADTAPKPPTPSLKQQQGEALGQPGSGTTSDQKEQQAPKSEAPPPTRTYQLCSMHATIQQRADTLASQTEAAGQSTPEDSDPKSIHSKMLQVELKQRTSNMPSGERTAQG